LKVNYDDPDLKTGIPKLETVQDENFVSL